MNTRSKSGPSHLFTMRVWREDLGGGRTELRGQAKHVVSGAMRSFRRWKDLETFVSSALEADEEEGSHDEQANHR